MNMNDFSAGAILGVTISLCLFFLITANNSLIEDSKQEIVNCNEKCPKGIIHFEYFDSWDHVTELENYNRQSCEEITAEKVLSEDSTHRIVDVSIIEVRCEYKCQNAN